MEEPALEIVLSVAGFILALVAIYFSYKLTRFTGGFRAWWLIIVGLVLITAVMVDDLLEDMNVLPVSRLGQDILRFAVTLFLFLGIYDLYMTFKKQAKEEIKRVPKIFYRRLAVIPIPVFVTVIAAEYMSPLGGFSSRLWHFLF